MGKILKGYKGFNSDFTCRGKQYEENTVFEEDAASICKSGMHFCVNPFDVLDYYGFVDDAGNPNEFAPVEALAKTKTDDNKKFCTTKLKIGAKLGLSGFINACVDFMIEKTRNVVSEIGEENNNDMKATQIGSSGYGAKIGSSGDGAQIGSSGDCAQIGSSGDGAQIGSSGDGAKIGSSGYGAQIGSSGSGAQIGSSGDGAQIGSSGDGAKIGSSGDDCVICCAGDGSIVKAKKGSWITLSEWKYLVEKDRYVPVCVKTEKVDGERIKADTFYKLVNGKFVEAYES